MKTDHPKIYMISRLLSDTQMNTFAGEGSELIITPRLYASPGGQWEYFIEAKALSEQNLLRVIEVMIWELESMRRDVLRPKDA